MEKQLIPYVTYESFFEDIAEIDADFAKAIKPVITKSRIQEKRKILKTSEILRELQWTIARNLEDGTEEDVTVHTKKFPQIIQALETNFGKKYSLDMQMENAAIIYESSTN